MRHPLPQKARRPPCQGGQLTPHNKHPSIAEGKSVPKCSGHMADACRGSLEPRKTVCKLSCHMNRAVVIVYSSFYSLHAHKDTKPSGRRSIARVERRWGT